VSAEHLECAALYYQIGELKYRRRFGFLGLSKHKISRSRSCAAMSVLRFVINPSECTSKAPPICRMAIFYPKGGALQKSVANGCALQAFRAWSNPVQ